MLLQQKNNPKLWSTTVQNVNLPKNSQDRVKDIHFKGLVQNYTLKMYLDAKSRGLSETSALKATFTSVGWSRNPCSMSYFPISPTIKFTANIALEGHAGRAFKNNRNK